MTSPRMILFGKLPSRGDFLARGLAGAALEAWDGWFSAQIDGAKSRLGADFPAAHDAAPPWRFVDPPGPFGSGWRAGAFAPSIDSVGRRFFVMAAADQLSTDQAVYGVSLSAAIEDVIYEAFEQGWDADAVLERGDAVVRGVMDAGEPTRGPPVDLWTTSGGPTLPPTSLDHRPADIIGACGCVSLEEARP